MSETTETTCGDGCDDHNLRRREDGLWELFEHGEVTYTHGPEMSAVLDRLVAQMLEEYEDRDYCNPSKYEGLDGTLCVHNQDRRLERYDDGRPFAVCRQAMREVFSPKKEGD